MQILDCGLGATHLDAINIALIPEKVAWNGTSERRTYESRSFAPDVRFIFRYNPQEILFMGTEAGIKDMADRIFARMKE